jgi:hypothetical protein
MISYTKGITNSPLKVMFFIKYNTFKLGLSCCNLNYHDIIFSVAMHGMILVIIIYKRKRMELNAEILFRKKKAEIFTLFI